MRKTAITLGFLLCFVSHLFADNRPVDVKVLRERTFTGTALYGFMNGGSDLYYEYDFVELKAIDLEYSGEKFSVEIYAMKSPLDAFGIYSIHAFGFHSRDTIFDYSNFSRYQMQAVAGNYYISVVYGTPCEGINKKAVEVVRNLFAGDLPMIELPAVVQSRSECVTGNVKLMRGELSVMNGAPGLHEYMTGVSRYYLWGFTDKKSGKDLFFFVSDNEQDLRIVTDRIPDTCLVSKKKEGILFHIN